MGHGSVVSCRRCGIFRTCSPIPMIAHSGEPGLSTGHA
jgi:hypothetical protein